MTYPLETVIVVQNADQLRAVYALLGGVSGNATAILQASRPAASGSDGGTLTKQPEAASPSPSTSGSVHANPDGVTHDAAGTPFDPARHTGSIVKSGLWRMKAGIPRGPGEGEDAIPASGTGTSATATGSSGGSTAPAPAADDDDEFAAFARAAGNSPTTAPARKWTVEDLSKLTNQAAQKLGDPAPVKELIGQYVPAGEVPHSRNIPEDKREAFAKALEARAGITFEG